jgi:hypothetical protein
MSTYTIGSGTYTDFNYRTLSNIVLIGNIVVVGNFEIRSSGFIDFSQATITSTGSGQIVMMASGLHPNYPGVSRTVDGGSYPHYGGTAILSGTITASQCHVTLVVGMPDAFDPSPVLCTAVACPINAQRQITAASLLLGSVGYNVVEDADKNSMPLVLLSEISILLGAIVTANRVNTAFAADASLFYRALVSGIDTRICAISGSQPQRRLIAQIDYPIYLARTPWNGKATSLQEFSFATSFEGIKISQIGTYFGDTSPFGLQEVYRAGALVPQYAPRAPSSGFAPHLFSGNLTSLRWYSNGSIYTTGSYGELYVNGQIITTVFFQGQFNGTPPAQIQHGNSIYYIASTATNIDGSTQYSSHLIAITRGINTSIATSGEIRFSGFFGAKTWTVEYTQALPPPSAVTYVKWFPFGDTNAGPQPGAELHIYVGDIYATNIRYIGQFDIPVPSTVTYSGTTYNITQTPYQEEPGYVSYHTVTPV